jgi:hypothetical protein
VLYRPRQWGETTFARQVAGTTKAEYFDLKDPVSQRRRSEPMLALRDLRGLVIVDEVHRQPELFPVLRVLADRKPLLARFLILGLKSGMACTGQHYIDACCPFRFGSERRFVVYPGRECYPLDNRMEAAALAKIREPLRSSRGSTRSG